MTFETEFKFAIDASCLQETEDFFTKSSSGNLESTYYDTENQDLKLAGVFLRIRRDGNRLIQTIKLPPISGNAFTRREHEIELNSPEINRKHLKRILPDDVRKTISKKALEAQFTTRFTRQKQMLPENLPVAEAVLDIGEIVTGDAVAPISEVEFELVRTNGGPDIGALADVCLEFLDRVPAGIAIESKASRGFRLAADSDPQAVTGKIPVVAPSVPLPVTILTLMRQGFSQFVGNIPAVRNPATPRSIHQMRVGLRRFRSTLSAFRPVLALGGNAAPLIEETKALFAMLGAVRDSDVFLKDTLPDVDEKLLTAGIRNALEDATTEHRARALAELQNHIASTDFARFVVRLAAWIESGVWLRADRPVDRLLGTRTAQDYAAIQLDLLHTKLLKRGRKARRKGIIAWHEARIAAKKLRYTSEPLLSALALPEKRTSAYTASLKGLQDTLGVLNDIETSRSFVAILVDEAPDSEKPQLEAARQLLLSWAANRERALLMDASKTFRAFEKAGFPGKRKS